MSRTEVLVFTATNEDKVPVVVTDFGQFEILLSADEARTLANALTDAATVIEAGGNTNLH